MKTPVVLFAVMILFSMQAFGQFTIDQCQEKARQNYPQIKQFGLIEKSLEYNLSNAGKAYLPQVSFTAKATYQSDAISLEVPIGQQTTMSIHQSKDQYQAVLDVNQIVWDGGTTSIQKKVHRDNAAVESQKLEVDLYAIKDRVNQLFFGCLLIDEQLQQNAVLNTELQTNYDKVASYMRNGVANQADLDAVRLEQLNNGQRRTELLAARKSYGEMLSAMMGIVLADESSLLKPSIVMDVFDETMLKRPEIGLFDRQLSLIDHQTDMIKSGTLPKVGLFVQGGYGRPGLNMLQNDFSPFYIGGVRLSWNISGFYTQKNNLNNLKINKEMVSNQKETFLFNNSLKIKQQNNELDKMRQLLRDDDEIIRLHVSLKKASEAKVANGVQSVTDLLREVNAESLARQQKSLHEIQLLLDTYNLKYSTNN
ncbi:MAG: TolC family protein [Bacteroidales bacterium]|nr:TolC family protein [Bacteroidales bacterium]